MAIKYGDQASIVGDKSFRSRVQAGVFVVALQVQSQAVSGVGFDLANEVIERANANISPNVEQFAVPQFCWLLVGQSTLNSVDDLTDVQIRNLINTNWTQIALALNPQTGLPGP